MDMTELFGKGKAFEPPFHTDSYGSYIFDKNNEMMLETRGFGHLQYIFKDNEIGKVYETLANHIVELLNERWKDETMRP